MARKKRKKKRSKRFRLVRRFLKSPWAPGWIGPAVVMAGAFIAARAVHATILFWWFASGTALVIGCVLAAGAIGRRLARDYPGVELGDPADFMPWEPSESEPTTYYQAPEPEYRSPVTNLPPPYL